MKKVSDNWIEALSLARYSKIESYSLVAGMLTLELVDPAGQKITLVIKSAVGITLSNNNAQINLLPAFKIEAITEQ